MQLSNENIEEYILLLADHELDGPEEAEVRHYIAQHQAYKPMLDAYLAARLDVDEESYIFLGKESLLKPETVALPVKRNISPLRVAAALVLIIGIGAALTLGLSRKGAGDMESIAPLQAGKKGNTPAIQPSVNTTADSPQMAAVLQPQANKVPAPAIKHNTRSLKNNDPVVAANTKEHNIATVPAQLEGTALNKVELSERKAEQTIAMVEQYTSGVEQHEHKGIPGWLPVNEENLQGINSLIDHIQSLKEGIQQKAQSLKNTALVIRIGERQFSIGK